MTTISLFDASYFGPRRPAWHHLGQLNSTPVNAREAFRRAGAYDVTLAPAEEPEKWKIRRGRTASDACIRIFGRVGREFVLVPPDEVTELWDLNVSKPVETLGALWAGKCLFITTTLDPIDVRGDALDNYLVLAHWMTPDAGTEIFEAPVRVVCQNTLLMAQRKARERVVLTPGPDVRERMAENLTHAVRRAQERTAILRAQCEALADRRATAEDTDSVLQAAFPADATRRTATMELFEGAGTGMDTPAARGTLWGLYNAVAELENFREGDTLKQAAASVLFGERGAAIERAFDAALRCCFQSSGHVAGDSTDHVSKGGLKARRTSLV